MTHKLKALGIALLAALAIGAMGAQAAAADLFVSEVEDTVIQSAAEELTFAYDQSGTVACGITNFYGTMEGSEATELVLTPTYDECTFADTPETFRTNHCWYVLTTETVKEEEEIHAPFRIECENEGEQIEHEVSAFGHCLLTVAPQTAHAGVSYEDKSGEIEVTFTVEMTGTRDNPESNFFCSLIPAEKRMSIEGTIRLEGYEYEGGPETEFTSDETAAAEERGITHWTWTEGSPVAIEVETEE